MSSPPKEGQQGQQATGGGGGGPSPNKEGADLKAGHPPAVKLAGGVRITQHKPPKEQESATKSKDKEEEEEEKAKPPSDDHRVLMSGVVLKGDKDFPPEAVKSFHEKPLPTAQSHSHAPVHHVIHQPRK